jgi:hypothetical protein
MGTITETDIAQAVAEGKNPNEVRIRELITRHPDRHQHGDEPRTAARTAPAVLPAGTLLQGSKRLRLMDQPEPGQLPVR